MMGQAVGQQDRLFYEFNLDERVPTNHLLRRIDAVLDLSWLTAVGKAVVSGFEDNQQIEALVNFRLT